MGQENNTVILRVQLSEEDTEKKLSEIAIKLVDTRKASQELTKAYAAGKVSADEFGQQSVKLNGELRMTQTEQRNITKTLDAYRAAQNAQTGSYDQYQKQLTLAQVQLHAMAGSADLSSEASQSLNGIIGELRQQLLNTDKTAGLFVRQVGAYPDAADAASQATAGYANNLVGLRQKLADLSKERETADVGTERFEELNRAILDTRTAVQQAEGKIDEFGDKGLYKKPACRPLLRYVGRRYGWGAVRARAAEWQIFVS